MAFDTSGIRLKPCVDLFSTEASRQDASLEKIREIPLDQLVPFKNHPFKVIDDESMMDTVQSIREHGILLPLIARPMPDGKYEIVSGHRRSHAGKLAGMETAPVIVRELDDDAAVILMVDSNLQRENILPSERAFAFKMKLEAIKHQGQRADLTSGQVGQKLKGHSSIDLLADQVDESRKQVQRYVRLNKLIPPLLDAVDAGTLKFVPAADFLSHLSEKEQTYLLLVMERDEVYPSLGQAQRLKQLSAEGKLENNIIDLIMREEKPLERKVTIRNDRLQKYFPSSYTPKQMEDVIIKLLEGWHRKRQQEMSR